MTAAPPAFDPAPCRRPLTPGCRFADSGKYNGQCVSPDYPVRRLSDITAKLPEIPMSFDVHRPRKAERDPAVEAKIGRPAYLDSTCPTTETLLAPLHLTPT